jgi:hypothetical protein
MHRQVTQDVAAVRPGLFHALALEGDSRVFRDIKEMIAAKILIAVVVLGVDARDVDRRCHRRFLRMISIDIDRAFEFLKVPSHEAKKVAHLEADRGMDRIDLVGASA